MTGISVFGLPDEDPSQTRATEIVADNEARLFGVVASITDTMGTRVDDQEDVIVPLVRDLVKFGQFQNARAATLLADTVGPLQSAARTANAIAGGELARLEPILSVTGQQGVTDTVTDPVLSPPTTVPTLPPTTDPTLPGTGRVTCPPGTTPAINPATGTWWCPPDGTAPAPSVPPVVPPPPPGGGPVLPPTPAPATSCTIITSGTLTCLGDEGYWVQMDCSNPAGVVYQVVKCCDPPPAAAGWNVYGPYPTPPDSAELKRLANACLAGTTPVPPSGTPDEPLPPPAPPDEPTDDEPKPPGEELPPAPVERPVPAVLDCTPINYADPRACLCIDDWVKEFGKLGRIGLSYHTWMQSAARELNDFDVIRKEAAAGGSLLKFLVKKLAFADMTAPQFADLLFEIVQSRFMGEIDKYLAESVRDVMGYGGSILPDNAQALAGIYLARAFIRLVEDYMAGPLAREFRFPVGSMDLTHVHQFMDMLIAYLAPIRVPTLSDVEDLWRTGRISETHAACLTQLTGHQWGITRAAFLSRSQQPSGIDLVNYQWRTRLPQAEFNARLRELGYVDPRAIDVLKVTQAYLPPPSDAIRMAVKDVFDPAKLGRAEMLEELKQQRGLVELFEAIGLTNTTITGPDGKPFPVPVPELYWMASYEECSPTQAYEMLHRLRPNRVNRYPLPNGKGGVDLPQPMDVETVRKLLKEKDYNPIWRDRLAAISFNVPGRIDIRRMYALGVFGKPQGPAGWNAANIATPIPQGPAELELVERYQDLGYGLPDARILGYYTSLDFSLGKVRKTQTRKQAAILRAYRNGTLGHQEAIDRLTKVTGSNDLAVELVDLEDVANGNQRVEDVTRAVRRLYTTYQVDRDKARGLLAAAGINPARIADLLARWDVVLSGRGREIAAGSLCGYFAAGVISRDEFLDRLVRAGYARDEGMRIVRKCELGELAKSAKQVAREAAAERRAQATRQRALEKAANQAQAAQQKALTRRLSALSEKNLIAFWKAGVITVEEIRGALALKGWAQLDVDRWVLTYLKGKDSDGTS